MWRPESVTGSASNSRPVGRSPTTTEPRTRAVSLGRRRDQISIWDVINTEEIQTGGKGADVEKHDRRSNPEAAVEDDGRRRPGVGEAGPRAVSQTGRPTVAVVKFATGAVKAPKRATVESLAAALVEGIRDRDPLNPGPFREREHLNEREHLDQ